MCTLVTGVAGFVGSHLAEALLGLGLRVAGVDNFSSGHPGNMATFRDHPNFIFHERSITEPGLLTELHGIHPGLAYCFHLAAIVSVPYSMEHEKETMEVNHLATEALLDEARTLGLARFVFAGSAAEYGQESRMPILEDYAHDGTAHLSPYGRAKFLASRAVASSPLGVSLRFFNIYGPRQDPSSPYSGVISRFTDLARADKPLSVHGDGSQSRDFVHVSDCVAAYLAAAGLHPEYLLPGHGSYNIGTGRATSILDLARLIMEMAGNTREIIFTESRPGDIPHSLASIEKFSSATGWNARVELKDGLRALWQSQAD
ncbi:MAG: NAD-dependent epimerase/dehydratase family protein [Humidesulfovibrio sp.]|nr:NAD-dependent epimerase/dehydratase family protein [Humidesulfovibrio sp.]